MLYCTTDFAGEGLIMSWNRHVVDGTPCNIGSQDMCINGMCKVSTFCITEIRNLVQTILINYHKNNFLN